MSGSLDEALALHRAGRLEEAKRLYDALLAAEPDNPDAWQLLGLIALSRGDPGTAAANIRRAIAVQPNAAVYHVNLGLALRQGGDLTGAIASYRRAVQIEPGLAEAHNNLGNCLRETGDAEGAVAACRQATALRPTFAEAHLSLSRALQDLHRIAPAETAARRAVSLNPGLAAAHFQLGNILQVQGRFAESEGCYREVLRIDPSVYGVRVNLGNVLVALGRREEAGELYRDAIAADPNDLQAHLGFIRTRMHLRRYDDAIHALKNAPSGGPDAARDFAEIYFQIGMHFQERLDYHAAFVWLRKAVATSANFALAHHNLGLVLQHQGRLQAAANNYRRAVDIDPTLIEARKNLAVMLLALGTPGDAINAYREGVGDHPELAEFQRLLVAATMYDPSWTSAARFAEARRLAAYAKTTARLPVSAASRDPRRRLRIGYVSSDFRDHPVGRNIEPLLAHRDRERFEVTAYAELHRPDAMTEQLQRTVDRWRTTAGRTDADVAAQIHADGIDILVVLAGHLDENRLLVCSHRPAPVQVSFHDVTTSGLEDVDYLIADRTVCPPKPAELFTERVIRLPSIYVHSPIAGAPDVMPPPLAAEGRVTFGSFNNPTKLNGATIALWGRILRAVPGSRLLLKFRRWFEAPELQDRLRSAFAAAGAGPDAVEFLSGDEPLVEHLQTYHRVDIALDPYPFTGSTTTFEALWMGVPVVTLAGETMMSRWSASMLKVLDLDDLITDSPERYVAIAASLASDPDRLATLRSSLRERIMRSPLVDGKLRARQIERIYRAIWTRWCRNPSPADMGER